MVNSKSIFLLYVGVMVGLMGIGQAAYAKSLYVEIWGADSGSCGTKSLPCRTIQQALTNTNPGDKVIVGPGEYLSFSGSVITLNKDRVKLESAYGPNVTAIYRDTVGTVILALNGQKMSIGRKGKGFSIRTTSVANVSNYAIFATGADKLKIEGNRIDTAGYGIYLNASENALMRGNTLTGSSGAGSIDVALIRILGDSGQAQIRENELHRSNQYGMRIASPNALIVGNLITKSSSYAIWLNELAKGARLQDNATLFNPGALLAQSGSSSSSMDGLRVEKNTSLDELGGEFSGAYALHGENSVSKIPLFKGNATVRGAVMGLSLIDVQGIVVQDNHFVQSFSAIDQGGTTYTVVKNNNAIANSGGCAFSGAVNVPIQNLFSTDPVCVGVASPGVSTKSKPNSFKPRKAAKL